MENVTLVNSTLEVDVKIFPYLTDVIPGKICYFKWDTHGQIHILTFCISESFRILKTFYFHIFYIKLTRY